MTKKVYLQNCHLCGESKSAIKYSQSQKDPIYCVLMGSSTESGSAEAYAEYDHHVFVVTQKQLDAEAEEEKHWFASHGVDIDKELADFKGFN